MSGHIIKEISGGDWENCTLRKWLNKDFYFETFNKGEQAEILPFTATAKTNSEHKSVEASDTVGRISLLSILESERYFTSETQRACGPTAYARARGVWGDQNSNHCWWWLRSAGEYNQEAAYVGSSGQICRHGLKVTADDVGVRPALWIRLDL